MKKNLNKGIVNIIIIIIGIAIAAVLLGLFSVNWK
jgi:hypothetical protein